MKHDTHQDSCCDSHTSSHKAHKPQKAASPQPVKKDNTKQTSQSDMAVNGAGAGCESCEEE